MTDAAEARHPAGIRGRVTGAIVEDQAAASVGQEHDLFRVAAGVDRDRAIADDGAAAADEAAARDVDQAARAAREQFARRIEGEFAVDLGGAAGIREKHAARRDDAAAAMIDRHVDRFAGVRDNDLAAAADRRAADDAKEKDVHAPTGQDRPARLCAAVDHFFREAAADVAAADMAAAELQGRAGKQRHTGDRRIAAEQCEGAAAGDDAAGGAAVVNQQQPAGFDRHADRSAAGLNVRLAEERRVESRAADGDALIAVRADRGADGQRAAAAAAAKDDLIAADDLGRDRGAAAEHVLGAFVDQRSADSRGDGRVLRC